MQAIARFVFALLLAARAGADVLVVDPGAGPFTTIDAAASAAQPGDTVLVKSGTYGALAIGSKSLVISADVGANVQLTETLTVQNLAAGDSIVLRGLNVESGFGGAGLRVLDSAGEVWAEDCLFEGTSQPRFVVGVGAVIENSSSASLVRCELRGGSGGAFLISGGDGLLVRGGSEAHLYDCIVRGGTGPTPCSPGPGFVGGAGARVRDGFLYASGSTFFGGLGGAAFLDIFGGSCFDGGPGGPGLILDDAAADVQLHDHAAMGGSGGPAGGAACFPGPAGADVDAAFGTLTLIPGTARRVDASHPVREGQSLAVTYSGVPGDLVLHFAALDHVPLFAPALGGTALIDAAALVFVGSQSLPAGGPQQVSVPIALIPGPSALVYTQVIAFHPSEPLPLQLGNGQAVLVLDAAF